MKYIYIFLIALCISSCKSPSELLKNGNYVQAFDKAIKEIKKGKNVDQNVEIIEKSTELRVASALRYADSRSKSDNVKDWVTTQTKLYGTLEEIGEANILLKGSISEPYDELCTVKKDIDYQIVEHYYDEGHDYLDDYYSNGSKEKARSSYYSFEKCEKHEGQSFFPDLADNKEDAYQNGIVYYVSDYGRIGSKLFLKPLPTRADFKPDCDISIDHGFVDFSTSESESVERHSEKIETGKEEITDTSGQVTYIPIIEKVKAKVITKTITVTARVTTQLRSRNVTGQCSVRPSSFTTEISDTYEEVRVEGDIRALKHHVDTKTGEPSFFRGGLESDLIDKADGNIGL